MSVVMLSTGVKLDYLNRREMNRSTNCDWIEQNMRETIHNYSLSEKKKLHVEYLENALIKIPEKINDPKELADFQGEITVAIDALPVKKEEEKLSKRESYDYIEELERTEKYIKDHYGYVRKDYYKSNSKTLVLLLGLPLFILISYGTENFIYGIPSFLFGLVAVFLAGYGLDYKAEKDDRVL